jgi:hypothetical protein
MTVKYNPIKATAGRGAAMEPVTRSQTSTESANTPAYTAPTDATQATAGRGNFFTKYKTPLIIGGALLLGVVIFQMNRRKSK